MIQIDFNDFYLNQTVNKDVRRPGELYLARCWHETVNSSGDPHSTLKWNLKATQTVRGKVYDVYSSYDVLIALDGTPFRYVDWTVYNSWSEGVSSAVIDGKTYRDNELGRRMFGVELDGPNTGKPATSAQIETAGRLILFTEETLSIPADGKHDFTHAQIAPGRKSDPKGYTVQEVLEAAAALRPKPIEPDWKGLWGGRHFYGKDWGIPTLWRQEHQAGRHLGEAQSDEFAVDNGRVCQIFTHGAIWWTPAGMGVWR